MRFEMELESLWLVMKRFSLCPHHRNEVRLEAIPSKILTVTCLDLSENRGNAMRERSGLGLASHQNRFL